MKINNIYDRLQAMILSSYVPLSSTASMIAHHCYITVHAVLLYGFILALAIYLLVVLMQCLCWAQQSLLTIKHMHTLRVAVQS